MILLKGETKQEKKNYNQKFREKRDRKEEGKKMLRLFYKLHRNEEVNSYYPEFHIILTPRVNLLFNEPIKTTCNVKVVHVNFTNNRYISVDSLKIV